MLGLTFERDNWLIASSLRIAGVGVSRDFLENLKWMPGKLCTLLTSVRGSTASVVLLLSCRLHSTTVSE